MPSRGGSSDGGRSESARHAGEPPRWGAQRRGRWRLWTGEGEILRGPKHMVTKAKRRLSASMPATSVSRPSASAPALSCLLLDECRSSLPENPWLVYCNWPLRNPMWAGGQTRVRRYFVSPLFSSTYVLHPAAGSGSTASEKPARPELGSTKTTRPVRLDLLRNLPAPRRFQW